MEILLGQVREAQDISQDRLAKMIDQSRTNIQNIERGRAKSITFSTLEKLCAALNCQPGDLFRYVPDTDAISQI